MILNTDKQKTSALHVGIALRIGHAQSQTCGADASRHRH